MNTVRQIRPSVNPPLPPLRAARASAVLGYFTSTAAGGRVYLDEHVYWRLRGKGLLRAAVDRALSDLADQGSIQFDPRPGQVVVVLTDAEGGAQ